MLIRQATVLDPSSALYRKTVDVLVEDGVIEEIGDLSGIRDTPVLEGEDIYISSGWVDAFADYREPGYEQKENIATGLAAAAAGGFTDVLLVPGTMPVMDSKATIQFALQRAAGNVVSLHPLGAVSRQAEGKALAEMLDMRAYGAIGFTDGWKPVQSSGLLLKALEYVKAFGGQIIQLPVDEALAAGGLMHEGERSTRLGMPGIPALAESLIVHRDIELARYTSSRLHLTGISAAASVGLIRAAKAQGVAVTCSVTPYHLVLNDAALETYNSLYKVTPPLRGEEDRQALIAGVKDGTIDCIASHHRPQDWDAKHKEFEYAGEGMAIQEVVFPLLWSNVGADIGPERLADALSSAPRRIFGLPSPVLEKGAAASMTVFTTSQAQAIRREAAQSLAYNNPFLDQSLQGKVLGIFNNGKTTINN